MVMLSCCEWCWGPSLVFLLDAEVSPTERWHLGLGPLNDVVLCSLVGAWRLPLPCCCLGECRAASFLMDWLQAAHILEMAAGNSSVGKRNECEESPWEIWMFHPVGTTPWSRAIKKVFILNLQTQTLRLQSVQSQTMDSVSALSGLQESTIKQPGEDLPWLEGCSLTR